LKHLRRLSLLKPRSVGPSSAELGNWRTPLVITQNGKAAGVVLSPERFDELTERARFSEAVNAGLADSDADRVLPHEVVVDRMQKRAKQRRG
jgi:PHD/YefM family antitoxin component YafN of YafNO toxin-antitoxin module